MYKNRKNVRPQTNNVLKSINENQQLSSPPLSLSKVAKMDVQNQIDVHTLIEDDDEDNDLMGSQASVPSSQQPTQMRYFSQRSALLTQRTQSTRSFCRSPNSYYEMVLMKAGVDLDQPDNYVLSCDHVTFVNNFQSLIKKHPDFPKNIQTFIEGLSVAFTNQNTEMKILSGCTIKIPFIETRYQSQDTMMMNFLMINFLQKYIIEVLLKRIEYCAKNNVSNHLDVPILSLLLSQLKFVSSIFGDLLYDKILKIYLNATVIGQQRIIENAEFVFDPIKHDDFVQFLINNTESVNDLLCSNNVQTFANLYLSAKMQTKLRKKILLFINNGCAISRLPFLVKFLLKIIDDNEENITELVMDLRLCLSWKEDSITKSQDKIQKIIFEIFRYIKQGLIRSKKLFDMWLKSIQKLSVNDTKSIDLIIFLMLISIREDRSLQFENIIRNQVKFEHLIVSIVDEAKTNYLLVIDLYGDIFLQILHNFLKDKNSIVCEFAKKSYNIIFQISESYQKKILNKLVEIICNKSSSDVTTIALDVLKNLNTNLSSDVQKYGMLLLPMLEQINDMNLKQSRIVMELLCSIAYPLPPLSDCQTLQEHIDMLVKKQICNRKTLVKKQGIIGTVQLIDHIVRFEDPKNSYDNNLNIIFNTVDDLPEGRGKQAGSYITRILSATNYCTEVLALFFDELAEVFSNKNPRNNIVGVDKNFLIWLCNLITLRFENNFVIADDLTNKKIKGLELYKLYCTNMADNNEDSENVDIAINISTPVLESSLEAYESITILSSLFNLTCNLHKTCYGHLQNVDAIVCCAILLPNITNSIDDLDIFSDFGEILSKKILDIQFHTVNWFRTLIGAFADQCQYQPDMRKNILIRLSNIIELETFIRNLLKEAPSNYFPPICAFLEIEKPILFKKPPVQAKKLKNKKFEANSSKQNIETEGMSFLATMPTQSRIPTTKQAKLSHSKTYFESFYGPKEIYRQMDVNIILILREEFETEYPMSQEKINLCLGLLQFRFIMNDLVIKVESINGIKKYSSDQKLQYITNPEYFIRKIETFLPNIFSNLIKLQKELFTIVNKVKGDFGNAELFTDRLNLIKVCFGLCLRFLAAYFSYSEYNEELNKNHLKRSLQSIIQDDSSDNIPTLIKPILEKLILFDNSITDIKSAVYLYYCLLSLSKLSITLNFKKKIRDLCKTLLCRKWYNFEGRMEKGADCNILLDELIKGFLNNSSLKRLSEILTIVSVECKLLKQRDDILKSFPNLHKGNIPMFFKNLCEELISSVNRSVGEKKSENEIINIWEQSCENLNKLLDIVKSIDGVPRNLTLFLKYSNIYIKIFLQHGLPIFEFSLRKNPDRLNQLLKSLQTNTRFLHNLCCHSKAIKNTSIVTQIPFMRETIENLLFKVKAALAGNNCASVFWMGSLKNKDLTGQSILLQTNDLNVNMENSNGEITNDNSSLDESDNEI